MSVISTRGMGMAKVCHVRQALEQLCSDAYNPRTMCAQIMAEHEVTVRDVLNVCDMARDVVTAWREGAGRAPAQASVTAPSPDEPPVAPRVDRDNAELRARIAEMRAKALGEDG